MEEGLNLLGAVVAVAFYITYIGLFVLRLAGRAELGRRLAAVQFVAALPLVYLLFKAPELDRPALYYIQVGLMLAFLALEPVVDYILKVEYRQARRAVIAYVTFFFAATGGMLGVAALAVLHYLQG